MIKGKHLVIHGVILFVLSISLFLFEHLEQQRVVASRGLFIPTIGEGSIDSISFTTGDTVTTLFQKDNQWFYESSALPLDNPVEADEGRVATLFERLGRLNRENFIASERSAHSEMGVVEGEAVEVSLFRDGHEVYNFFIGKRAHIWSHSYVRHSNSSRIYSVGENLRYLFVGNPSNWRSNRLFKYSPRDIDHLLIQEFGEPPLHVTRGPDRLWYFPGSGEEPMLAPDSLVRSFIEAFCGLNAGSWIYETTPEMEQTFFNPSLTIAVSNEDGDRDALIIGGKDETGRPRYFARRANNPAMFALMESVVGSAKDEVAALREASLQ